MSSQAECDQSNASIERERGVTVKGMQVTRLDRLIIDRHLEITLVAVAAASVFL
jgi:hypothetical protein